MWPRSYFAGRYFAPTYWPQSAGKVQHPIRTIALLWREDTTIACPWQQNTAFAALWSAN